MALVVKDRVQQFTTTTGTGTITLSGAVDGFQDFSVIGDGNTTYYTITDGTDWEVGIGTYTSSGTTLSRDTILESSNSGSAVNWGAGSKNVFVTYPAEQSVYYNAAGQLDVDNLRLNGNTLSSTNTDGNVVLDPNGTGSVDVSSAKIINVATPTGGNDATNKTYVDSLISGGVHFHAPVRVESPGNLNATYDNGTDGVGATLTNAGTQEALVIDGITLSLNDRVLIYEQTDQTENGVYVVTDTGSVSTNWELTRASDADTYVFDSPDGLSEGSTFFVQEGDTGAGETYTCNTPGTITFGTTNITFVQVSSAQIYTAGAGLDLTGTQFSVETNGITNAMLRQSAGLSIVGRSANTTGDVADITAASDDEVLRRSGTSIGFGSVATGGIADNAVTDAKIRDSAALSVIGNATNATANPADIAAASDHEVLRRSGTSIGFGAIALNQANAVAGALPFDNGGTGQTTQQAAMNALAGAITSGQYLRGNGTNVSMSALAAADMTGTIAVANGGTGASTLTANNVILGNGTSAVQFVAPGTSGTVLTSNGTTWESQPAGGGSSFPAGTRMLFAQSTAPTGWTKDTINYDQHALRVVTGTAGTGGTVDFTTAFASQTPSGNVSTTVTASTGQVAQGGNISVSTGQVAQGGNISVSTGQTAAPGSTGNAASPNGNTTLGIPTIPSHSHTLTAATGQAIPTANPYNVTNGYSVANNYGPTRSVISNSGGSGAHTHPAGNHTHPFTGGQHAHPASGTFTGSQHAHPASGNFTGSQHAHPVSAPATSSFTGNAINFAVKYLDVITATKD